MTRYDAFLRALASGDHRAARVFWRSRHWTDTEARFCATCDRERLQARRAAARAAREALRAVERPPRPERRPRTKAASEPEPAAAPKPAPSKLPAGWERTTPPRTYPKPGKSGLGLTKILEVPRVEPTPPRVEAAALDTLARLGALDLAAMLGLEVAA